MCKEQIRALDEQRRNLKPPGQQLQQAENFLKRPTERLTKEKAAVLSTQEQLCELNKQLEQQGAAAAETETAIRQAEQEVVQKRAAAVGSIGLAPPARVHQDGFQFTEANLQAMQKIANAADPAKLGTDADACHQAFTQLLQAFQAAIPAAGGALADISSDGNLTQMEEDDVTDEMLLATVEAGVFAEGAGFAQATPEIKSTIKRKLAATIKAAATKDKGHQKLLSIASKAGKNGGRR